MTVGSIITDVRGITLTPQEQDYLCHPLIGGIILFSRNFESVEQLLALTAALRALPRAHRLLITVDQEGGRVQRFLKGFTRIPPMRRLGELYDKDCGAALLLAKQCGWVMASELVSVGVDLSFAPVLDLALEKSKAIGDRAFHPKPEVVVELASAFIAGMSLAGMSATGKHFPGHGSVEADSHHEVVTDKRAPDDIINRDLIVFSQLAGDLASVMTAHVIYPSLDKNPAGFSPYWLQTVLRQQLGFSGVIFSDDIHMQGACLGSGPCDRAWMALESGCDIILSCNHPVETSEIVARLERDKLAPAVVKLTGLYAKTKIIREDLLGGQEWQEASAAVHRFLVPPFEKGGLGGIL